jgi:hypothetical protein
MVLFFDYCFLFELSYFLESGELSVFQDDSFRPDAGPSFALPSENNSDESKALTLLWRSSKPAGLSEASLSQASIETEKPLPWWKRVVLSPFRFVARRVVRSLETPPAQQLISASCASDNKIAVALGSQVSRSADTCMVFSF